jgi:hypothetical protein
LRACNPQFEEKIGPAVKFEKTDFWENQAVSNDEKEVGEDCQDFPSLSGQVVKKKERHQMQTKQKI